MSNAKTIPNCPKCQTVGNVIGHRKALIKLECPECEAQWSTLSKLCKHCKKPNGYATEGVCSKCYSERYKS